MASAVTSTSERPSSASCSRYASSSPEGMTRGTTGAHGADRHHPHRAGQEPRPGQPRGITAGLRPVPACCLLPARVFSRIQNHSPAAESSRSRGRGVKSTPLPPGYSPPLQNSPSSPYPHARSSSHTRAGPRAPAGTGRAGGRTSRGCRGDRPLLGEPSRLRRCSCPPPRLLLEVQRCLETSQLG
eukprot:COSAG01_NODE_2562_length_7452_cov_3.643139_6_plen_185_part_00